MSWKNLKIKTIIFVIMNISKTTVSLLFLYSGLLTILYLPFSPVYILGFHDVAINYWVLIMGILTFLFPFTYRIRTRKSYAVASFLVTSIFIIFNVFPILAYISHKYPFTFQLLHLIAILLGILHILVISWS
jgi:hypothetical protein